MSSLPVYTLYLPAYSLSFFRALAGIISSIESILIKKKLGWG